MAITLSDTQLAALKEALASGVTSVEADGRKITYRSLADIERVIALAERANGTQPTHTNLRPKKGY